MSLEHEDITGPLIGAAIAVHRALGPGFLETVYDNALAIELRARSIAFRRQVAAAVLYRGVAVGLHRVDLVVGEEILVELKAVKDISDAHFAVVRSQLRALGKRHGLVLNFAKPTLEIRRVFTHPDSAHASAS